MIKAQQAGWRLLSRSRVPLVLAVAAVLFAAACSSSGGKASTSSSVAATSSAAPSSSAAASSSATANPLDLSKYQVPPTFKAPGPAFNAKAAAGKTVWLIPTTSAVPLVTQVQNAMKQAFDLLGVKTQTVTTTGLVTEWVAGIKQAIAQKADGIALLGIDPKLVGPQLADAAAAHIPVVYTFSILGDPTATNVFGNAAIDYPTIATVAALKSMVDTTSDAHIAILESKDLAAHNAMIPILTQLLSTQCPKCKIETTIDVPIANWSTQITPSVRSALTANPAINIVLPLSDTMSQYVIPAIRAANLTDKVKIETVDASAAYVQQIATGAVSSDTGWSNPWVGYATADQILRGITGAAAVTSENIPTVLFDSTNAAKVGANDPSVYFGDSYITGYKTLWGVS